MEIKKQKSAWDKLSMQEKAQLIKLSVDNGVSSLKQIRDTYNLYSSGNLTHKKSGKEYGESSWLNNGYNSSEDWQLQMKMNANQMLQNLQNSPFYMTNQEMQNLEFARMQEAIGSNSSSEAITYTGFDNNGNEITKRLPTAKGLNTMWDAGIIDYMPVLGDGKQMLDLIGATKNNDYLTAGLLGGMMFIPNIIEKPLKSLKTYAKNATNRALESVLRIGDEFAGNPFTFVRQMLGNKGSGLKYVFTGQPQLAYQMPYRYSGQVLWSPDNTVAESAHIGDLIDVIMGKSNVLLDEYGNTLGRLTDDITNVPDKTIAAFQSLPGKSDVLPKVLKFDQSALSPEFIPKQDIQQLINMPLNIPMEIGRRTKPRVPILQGGRTVSIVDPGHYGLTALKTDNGLQLFGHDVYHYTPKNAKQSNFSTSWMPNIPITVGNPFVVEWQVPELIYDASRLNSQSLLQLLPYSNVKLSNVKHLFNIKEFVANKTSKLSTGGPLYPFSFEKNPFFKTPVVRYETGGQIRDWDTQLAGKLINYVENSDSIGWVPQDRTWEHPTLPGYDKNQIGMGVDKNQTEGYAEVIKHRRNGTPYMTELDERKLRHAAIEKANTSANARYKFAQQAVNRPNGTISKVKDAAVVSAIYNLGPTFVANGLFEDRDFMLKLFDGTDKEVIDRINQEYKKKNRNERIGKTNKFLLGEK